MENRSLGNLIEGVACLFSIERETQSVLWRVPHFLHILKRKEDQRAVGITSVANSKWLAMFEMLFVVIIRMRSEGELGHGTDFVISLLQQCPSLICVSKFGLITIAKFNERNVQQRCRRKSSQPKCAEDTDDRRNDKN